MHYPIIPYNPNLRDRARQLRQNMTPGERKLWSFLRKKQMMSYDFDRQRPIDQFIVDFYCKALRLAIEVDGSSHDSDDAEARDRERQAKLEGYGIRFLRFREDDVLNRTQQVLAAIEDWIKENQKDRKTL